jgi:hypothetical protein
MFIDPSKVKRSKPRRPRFLVVYFRSPYYQEGLLDEKLGWNQILHYLTPLCNMVERSLQKSCLWGFSGRRLRVSEPETPACKGGDFDSGSETPAKESGLPKSVFTRVVQASVARPESLKRHSGDSEVFAPGSQRLRPVHAGDSGWHRRLRTPKSGDSGVSRPQRLDFCEGYK